MTIPYKNNPMGLNISLQAIEGYNGVWIYVSNAGTGTSIASAMTMNDSSIGSGLAGSGMKVLKDGVANRIAVTNLGKMYVSNDVDPTYPIIYSITLKDHSPNTLFLRDKSRAVKFRVFIENYKIGNVRFENMNIKNITYEVIQMCMYRF